VEQLRTENHRFQMLDDECTTKMHKYQQISMATDNKLDHLRSLGDDFSSSVGVLNFVKGVEEKRNFGEFSIRGEVQTVQLESHTTPSKHSYIRSS
jgi:hypothetical protein